MYFSDWSVYKMPRQKKFKCYEQELLEEELRARYGGMMTAAAVGQELGLLHHKSYNAWLADVPSVLVNGRSRWRVADIAEKIFRNRQEVII